MNSGNVLLCVIPVGLLNRVLRVKNSCCILLLKTRANFPGLHWLPIGQGIQHKVLMLTYNALDGLAPDYLSDLTSAFVAQWLVCETSD